MDLTFTNKLLYLLYISSNNELHRFSLYIKFNSTISGPIFITSKDNVIVLFIFMLFMFILFSLKSLDK